MFWVCFSFFAINLIAGVLSSTKTDAQRYFSLSEMWLAISAVVSLLEDILEKLA